MSVPTHIVIREVGHPLCGHRAVLRRVRRGDDGAWFEIVEPLSAEARDFASSVLSFPVGDHRAQHVLLFPDQYREAAPE
jgi:hypothetical protein